MGAEGGTGNWVSRHKWLTAFVVLVVFGWASNAGADEAEPDRGQGRSAAEQAPEPQGDSFE